MGDPDRTFISGGTSHALALVTQLLTSPGDVVVVDSPTYHLAFPILRDHGLTLLQAPAGLDPLLFARLVRDIRRSGKRVSMLYLVPTFGNPTGQSLPGDRRRAVIEVARQEGLTGLGYVHSGGGVNHTTAVTMGAFRAGGGYQRHVEKVRAEYRTQRNVLVSALREDFTEVEFPAGGWFVRLPLPGRLTAAGITADTLLPTAERHGVSFVPGTRFWSDGSGGHDRIRLSFSHLPADDLRRAAERLVEATAPAAAPGPATGGG